MRAPRISFALAALVPLLTGCTADSEDSGASETPLFAPETNGAGRASSSTMGASSPAAPAPSPSNPSSPSAPPPSASSDHSEVVQVIMAGKDGWTWFCTGALVSPNIVVTAAHCLQSALFESWEVVFAMIAAKPRVKGTPAMYDSQWSDVAHPDLGIVRLATPVTLPQYAVLTDVSARVAAGEKLSVASIVRTAEKPEAAMAQTKALGVFSTTNRGYLSGYGVPLYSHGGDSGAGMFLVVNGAMSNELVGVEREPDPEIGADHLSRIDGAFIAWVKAQDR